MTPRSNCLRNGVELNSPRGRRLAQSPTPDGDNSRPLDYHEQELQ
jgi:hypothetical protein